MIDISWVKKGDILVSHSGERYTVDGYTDCMYSIRTINISNDYVYFTKNGECALSCSNQRHIYKVIPVSKPKEPTIKVTTAYQTQSGSIFTDKINAVIAQLEDEAIHKRTTSIAQLIKRYEELKKELSC
jgi:predicted methyltransferase